MAKAKNKTRSSSPLRKSVGAYKTWLTELKQNIGNARMQTSLQVNANMLMVYGYIGKQIQQKIENEKWGTGVIKRLAVDLQKAFPDTKGFSERNLKYMRQFAQTYRHLPIGQEVPAQLEKEKFLPAKTTLNVIGQEVPAQLHWQLITGVSWSHHLVMMDKVKEERARLWYIQQAIENRWSSTVLLHQIESDLFHRQNKTRKTTNFHLTLPKEQSDLALQILKDPYKFDFLSFHEKLTEKDLEKDLVNHLTKFLLELGNGFAFIGNQYKVKTPRKTYPIDLLFYHVKLKAYIVIELKMTAFVPGDASQLNFYLNIVDDFVRTESDLPSVGILLCKSKDSFEVEYALRGLTKPIGVAEYKMLPGNIRKQLPSSKQLRDVLNAVQKNHSSKTKKERKG